MWSVIALFGMFVAVSYYSYHAGYEYGCEVTRRSLGKSGE